MTGLFCSYFSTKTVEIPWERPRKISAKMEDPSPSDPPKMDRKTSSLPSMLDSEEIETLDMIRSPTHVSVMSSEASTMSSKSEREKVEEFTLRRNLEKLRVFYSVLQVAMSLLMGGVLLTTLSEILWRVIPAGKVSESIISGFAGLAWLLTSLTIILVSVCPTEELDIDIFVASRPGLSTRFAMLPLVTGGPRVLETPFPRWISVAVGLTLIVQGCSCCCSGCRCGKAMRRWLGSLSCLVSAFLLKKSAFAALSCIAMCQQKREN